jgi:hypothetical protein
VIVFDKDENWLIWLPHGDNNRACPILEPEQVLQDGHYPDKKEGKWLV